MPAAVAVGQNQSRRQLQQQPTHHKPQQIQRQRQVGMRLQLLFQMHSQVGGGAAIAQEAGSTTIHIPQHKRRGAVITAVMPAAVVTAVLLLLGRRQYITQLLAAAISVRPTARPAAVAAATPQPHLWLATARSRKNQQPHRHQPAQQQAAEGGGCQQQQQPRSQTVTVMRLLPRLQGIQLLL